MAGVSAVHRAHTIYQNRPEERDPTDAQRPKHPVEARLLRPMQQGADDESDGGDGGGRGGEIEDDSDAPGGA